MFQVLETREDLAEDGTAEKARYKRMEDSLATQEEKMGCPRKQFEDSPLVLLSSILHKDEPFEDSAGKLLGCRG